MKNILLFLGLVFASISGVAHSSTNIEPEIQHGQVEKIAYVRGHYRKGASVRGHRRKNGTYVRPHSRKGTYVKPYWRK